MFKVRYIPALVAALFSHNAMALEPFVIKDIRVEGLQRTEAGTIFTYLPVQEMCIRDRAYTEFYFTDTLWPDFNAKAFQAAIASYQQRERRFGRTSEQLSNR